MADTLVDPDRGRRDRQDKRLWRCLARVASTAAVALAALLLARGDPSPGTATAVVVGLWLWLAVSVIVGIVRVAIVGITTMESQTAQNPWDLIPRVPRVCAWSGVLLVASATAALFAAGQRALATTMEVFLLLRLALAVVGDRACEPDRNAPAATSDYTPLTSGSGMFAISVTAGVLWLALGMPPRWAEDMILTYFWIVVVGTIVAGNAFAFGSTVGRSFMQKHHEESWRQNAAHSGPPPPLCPPATPEPPRSAGQQLTMWVWRASWILIAGALWTAGQPLLAGLYLLASALKLAMRVRGRRIRHGDTARVDVFARLVYFIVWWPLVIVGTSAAAIIVIPFLMLAEVWDRIFGTSAARPQTDWEREQRLERARIRRATASYRLREAFGKPDGFVYFLYAEPHQRAHFLGPGGLLADFGDRVVARDWRADILAARNASGARGFRQTPEGALLHVNGIASLQKDLPLIAVVPRRGLVQLFRLADAYRSRRRDGGAALALAEAEVRTALAGAVAVKPSPTL